MFVPCTCFHSRLKLLKYNIITIQIVSTLVKSYIDIRDSNGPGYGLGFRL